MTALLATIGAEIVWATIAIRIWTRYGKQVDKR